MYGRKRKTGWRATAYPLVPIGYPFRFRTLSLSVLDFLSFGRRAHLQSIWASRSEPIRQVEDDPTVVARIAADTRYWAADDGQPFLS